MNEQFKNKRMENAWYWAAQARGFMKEQTTISQEEWSVEVLAGQAIIVMSDVFPSGGIDALENELHDCGFPSEWTRRKLEDETRIFIQPTDDRLLMNYDNYWRERAKA